MQNSPARTCNLFASPGFNRQQRVVHLTNEEKAMTTVNYPKSVLGVLAAVTIVLMQIVLFAHSATTFIS
jgi:hypothetical protein